MGFEDHPIGYLSGAHHALHSYVGVAASAVYYSGSGEKPPCCSRDAAGLFCVVGRKRVALIHGVQVLSYRWRRARYLFR
jgi:hypothetical protein